MSNSISVQSYDHLNKSITPSTESNVLSTATSGIPPWYTSDGTSANVFMIGISGGSASGKTSVADRVIKGINLPNVVLVSMDSFYKQLSPDQSQQAKLGNYDFDSPFSFDLEYMEVALRTLKQGLPFDIPDYDFKTHSRTSKSTHISGSTVVVFEGIMALYPKSILELLDLKVFVDTDDDLRLARRIIRDISYRGREQKDVLEMYFKYAKPGYDNYILPSCKNADLIIPRGGDNEVAINLLIKHIKSLLSQRGINFRRSLIEMCKGSKNSNDMKVTPPNVYAMEGTNCISNLLTIIRDGSSEKERLIEACHRLASLTIEYALSFKTFHSIKFSNVPDNETNSKESNSNENNSLHLNETNALHLNENNPLHLNENNSLHLNENNPLSLTSNESVCGVTIVRAGNIFEIPMRSIIQDLHLGKLLIQTDKVSGDPRLHFASIPSQIDSSLVFLMDSSIASGATAMMAIKVLLESGIPQEKIIFLALVCAVEGLIALYHAFPKVRVVCAAVDEGLDDNFFISPGFGNLGQRYFGI